jgi:hypothetical protein
VTGWELHFLGTIITALSAIVPNTGRYQTHYCVNNEK